AAHISAAADLLAGAGRSPRMVIDASHGNSGKDHHRQAVVAAELAGQVAAGNQAIAGVMLESFLAAGKQDPAPGGLTYGQSVTDACMSWQVTDGVLSKLAEAAL